MRSMIEQVKEAEAQAAKMRQDAQAEARDRVLYAQAELKERKLSAAEEERAALREASLKAEAEGEALKKALIEKRGDETDAACKAAEGKLHEAMAYILGRIVASK